MPEPSNNSSDIFIIGGGINGAGIATDAAGRGLSVTLCEKNDLASGTSSMSSKLIHGGLRYLETYDFSLVRKALEEREVLWHKAPHLISPLEFVLPHAKYLRSSLLIRAGLFLYDHLASHPGLPNSKKIKFANDLRGKALLPEYKIGYSYYDCFDDDARLVVTNAIAAQELGATILTRTECISATYKNNVWEIVTRNATTQRTEKHFARVLINAGGPWIVHNQKDFIHAENDITVELIKGSHIVIPKLYDGNFAYILQNPDSRIVFAIPYEDEFTLVGTTDVPYKNNLDDIKISEDEINYLLATIHRYFNKAVQANSIVWSYAGVRCLQEDKKSKAADITRDYKFTVNKDLALLTVISGKITTYRCLAEEALNQLKPFFPTMKNAWTANQPLPGGDIPKHDFKKFFVSIKNQYHWLPEKLALRYAKNYGTRMHTLLKNCSSLADLGNMISKDLYEIEIQYLQKYEWAQTAEDILWRRTKLGLFSTAADSQRLESYLSKNSAK